MNYLYLASRFTKEETESLKELLPQDYDIRTKETIQPEELKDITILFDNKMPFVGDVIATKGKLKFLQVLSTGIDYLPLDQLEAQGVILGTGHGLQRSSVTQHILALLLGICRRLPEAILAQEKGVWERSDAGYDTLEDKQILITGTGIIPQHLAGVLNSLGSTVDGINTTGHPVTPFRKTFPLKELENCLPHYDVVINLLPLTPETDQLFNWGLFQKMPQGSIFINGGRGPSIVMKDLQKALNHGPIAYAAVDVLENEPLAAGNPLWQQKNLIITSHVAGMSLSLNHRYYELCYENLKSFLDTGDIIKNKASYKRGY